MVKKTKKQKNKEELKVIITHHEYNIKEIKKEKIKPEEPEEKTDDLIEFEEESKEDEEENDEEEIKDYEEFLLKQEEIQTTPINKLDDLQDKTKRSNLLKQDSVSRDFYSSTSSKDIYSNSKSQTNVYNASNSKTTDLYSGGGNVTGEVYGNSSNATSDFYGGSTGGEDMYKSSNNQEKGYNPSSSIENTEVSHFDAARKENKMTKEEKARMIVGDTLEDNLFVSDNY